jgi:hypothetical protein
MRSVRSLPLLVGLVAFLVLTPPIHAQDSPVVGSWITTSWEGSEGDPEPGLLIFTETNYSMMFVPAGEVRERYEGETMTDAEMVEAMSTLVANSGRYTWEGNQLTTEAYVALNPNYMADWGENHLVYTFRIEDGLLYLTWPSGFITEENPPFTGVFRKVG